MHVHCKLFHQQMSGTPSHWKVACLYAVFAYGQTGSGKTYTMGSAFTPGGNTQGVIPKVMDSIFERINSNKDAEYTVRVGFVEIHKVSTCAHSLCNSHGRTTPLMCRL